jgi:hypothetical protein
MLHINVDMKKMLNISIDNVFDLTQPGWQIMPLANT